MPSPEQTQGRGGTPPRPVNAPAGPTGGIGVQAGVSGLVLRINQLVIFGTGEGIFVYNGTPASGTMVGSWAGTAGTDAYGNSYPAGLSVGSPDGTSQVQLITGVGGTGTASEVSFPIPALALSNTPNIGAGVVAGTYADTVLSGPAMNNTGDKDWVQIVMYSNDLGGNQAHMNFNYISSTGTQTVTAVYNGSGWVFSIGVTIDADLTVNSANLNLGNGSTSKLNLDPQMAQPTNYPYLTDNNTGSSWATGERSYINQCVNGLNALVNSFENHGMMA